MTDIRDVAEFNYNLETPILNKVLHRGYSQIVNLRHDAGYFAAKSI